MQETMHREHIEINMTNFTVNCVMLKINGNSRSKIRGNIVFRSRFIITIIIMKYKNATLSEQSQNLIGKS